MRWDVTGKRPQKDAKKGKASKGELLEAAKRRQEQLKSLEGTREGRVISPDIAQGFSVELCQRIFCHLCSCRVGIRGMHGTRIPGHV